MIYCESIIRETGDTLIITHWSIITEFITETTKGCKLVELVGYIECIQQFVFLEKPCLRAHTFAYIFDLVGYLHDLLFG